MEDKFKPYIEENKDITHLTTFGIPVRARYFAEYDSLRKLEFLMKSEEYCNNEILHIGGGSNLLFVNDFNGFVLHSAIKGIKRYDRDDEHTYVIAGAGEKWTDLVEWCVKEGLSGLENLAGIPGEVGASAVQNVGAYGSEAKDVIFKVECYDTLAGRTVTLSNEDCRFGYRDSMFKHEGKGRYYVLRVAFRLNPDGEARHLDYGPLKQLKERLGHKPTIEEVATEVKTIRNSKLPDPAEIGSAGSFFKNPVVNKYYYEEEVLGRCPDVPCYPIDDHHVKVPAGWLIEHAGLKGKRIGGAEVYPKQCLVLCNAEDARAEDVTSLCKLVKETVLEKFGIQLHPEVNFIDTSIDVTVMGTGTSKGVPEVGCRCRVCRSADSRDKRTRTSLLVKTHGLQLMIDVSPDFREQALKHGIVDVDAVLITHSHYDHVGGIDDLRPFCVDRRVPVYAKKDVDGDLRRRYDYCFVENPYPGVPVFDMHVIDNRPFMIEGLKIVPVKVMHGKLPILGYRIGDFAFITDAKTIDESEKEKLYGLKVLIVNALRERPHFAHFNVDEALALINEVKPEKAYLTHFNHEVMHAELAEKLPANVEPAYDGLHFTIK